MLISLFASWLLICLIPPVVPSNRTLTWSEVMKLKMGWVELLVFTLFCTFSVEALVVYVLTNDEGSEISVYLGVWITCVHFNWLIFIFVVMYQYAIKPLICKSSTHTASSSVTNPDSFNFQENALSINSL